MINYKYNITVKYDKIINSDLMMKLLACNKENTRRGAAVNEKKENTI